jgi:hypothetical protein
MKILTCSKCKKKKSEDQFYARKALKSGKSKWCKECYRTYAKNDRREYFKQYQREYQRKYRKKYDKMPKRRERNRVKGWKSQGIILSISGYNKLYNEQKGRCCICGKHQSEINYPLYVDHNHMTGKVRGLVCRYCNFLIGVVENREKELKKIHKFIQEKK